MNVASQELCRELYELSEWEQDDARPWYGEPETLMCPKYGLKYLLKKTPESNVRHDKLRNEWMAESNALSRPRREWADTPEDAVCKLAIALFKAGVLKK